RRHPDGESPRRSHAETDGRPDSPGAVECPVPLLRAPTHDCGGETLRERRCGMTVSRRSMLKAGGPVVVSFAPTPSDVFGQAVASLVGNPSKEVDGWLSIAADGTVTALT